MYSLSLPDFTSSLRVVWRQSYSMRSGLHRLLGIYRCDTGLLGPGLRLGAVETVLPPSTTDSGDHRWFRLTGTCPCGDYLADILTEVNRYLAVRQGQLRNPAGAVRQHLRTRGSSDWTRRRRAAMGAQARTDRIRQSRHGRQLTNEFDRAILHRVVDEAGSVAPLDDQHQLVHRLADLMAEEFGGSRTDHLSRVVTSLQAVEAQCRTGPRVNVGTTAQPEFVSWWEAYVERPLGRRPRRTDQSVHSEPSGVDSEPPTHVFDLACRTAERELDLVIDTIAVVDRSTAKHHDDTDALVIAVLVQELTDDPYHDPETALSAAVRKLTTRGFITPATADTFLADDLRVRAAVGHLLAIRATVVAPTDPPPPSVVPPRTTVLDHETPGQTSVRELPASPLHNTRQPIPAFGSAPDAQ